MKKIKLIADKVATAIAQNKNLAVAIATGVVSLGWAGALNPEAVTAIVSTVASILSAAL